LSTRGCPGRTAFEDHVDEDCRLARSSEREKRARKREPQLVRRVECERLSILLDRLLMTAGSG
jgi:hypothetical protein